MKSIALYLTVLAGIALLVLGSCTQPLGGATTGGAVTDDSPGAELRVTIPAMGAGLRSLSEAGPVVTAQVSLDPEPRTRALMVVDGVDLTVYDASDEEVASASIPVGVGLADATVIDVSALPSGSGFYMVAEVFNTDVSSTDPVSRGTSDPFVISPGETTDVTITVVPNPSILTPLSDGVPIALEHTTSVLDSSTVTFVSMGGEEWFSYSPVGSYIRVTMTPNGSSIPLFSVFDATGAEINTIFNTGLLSIPQVFGGAAQEIFEVTPGETYYVAAMLFGSTSGTQDGSIVVEDNALEEDSYEPNDDSTEAASIVVGSSYTPNFHSATDVDWFQLTLTAGTTYVFTATPCSLVSPTSFDWVLLQNDVATGVFPSASQFNMPAETVVVAYVPTVTETHYLALAPDGDFPHLGDYTFTFETPTSGELDLTFFDFMGDLGDATCYMAITEVGDDPESNTIAEAVTTPGTAVTAEAYPAGGAWTGSGVYDVHVVIDLDDSGDATPTEGDYVGIINVIVNGDTRADLTSEYLYPYVEPDSYEPDDSTGEAEPITVNGGAQSHNLSSYTDVDYVWFDADGSSSYTVATTSTGNMTIDLLDSDGFLLASFELYGTPSLDSLGVLAEGTYYLNAYNGLGEYTVEVTSP